MIELEALNWSFQLLLYIQHDFGHVKSRRQKRPSHHIEDRIYLIQRSILPVFDLRHAFICNVWNKAFWCFKTVDIFDGFGYLTGRHPFCIHGNNLLIDIRNILLTFLYNLWLKCWFTILRNIDIHAAIADVYTFWFISTMYVNTPPPIASTMYSIFFFSAMSRIPISHK